MRAIVIGATGATGRALVDVLLKDTNYTSVSIFIRQSLHIHHPKLREYIIDFSNLEQCADLIIGDVLFSCLGTTLKSAGSKQAQWRIDFEIPYNFSTIAKRNGIHSLVLVSAFGANAKSSVFYSRMKGALEDTIAALAFEQYIIFRPGMLQRPNTNRLGEKIALGVLRVLNSIGILKRQAPLPTQLLAEKLAKAPILLADGESVVELEKIFSF
jgi:uncharacterized protein YbjT (DUF2867 family)